MLPVLPCRLSLRPGSAGQATDLPAIRGRSSPLLFPDTGLSARIPPPPFAGFRYTRDAGSLSGRQQGVRLGNLSELIQFGASPRAGIALTLAAKGLAFLEGRCYVVPQDVKDVAPDVLRHRIVPSYEAEAENVTPDNLIQTILDELRTP